MGFSSGRARLWPVFVCAAVVLGAATSGDPQPPAPDETLTGQSLVDPVDPPDGLLDAPDGLLDDIECADPKAEPPGYLSINTTPWTKVYVDGQPIGSTPLFKKKLPSGSHTVRLVNEGHQVDVSDGFEVEAGRTLKMQVYLTWDASASADLSVTDPTPAEADEACAEAMLKDPAFLSVRTSPWAKVFVDGKYVGHTPLFRVPVSAGDHVLRLLRDDAEFGLNVFSRFSAGEGEVVKIDLNPGQGA